MWFKSLGMKSPSSTGTYKFSVDEFKGLDKASGEDNFSPSRAAEMQNFIRDKVGRVTKRGGFVADTKDRGKYRWIKTWEDLSVFFEGNCVNAGGLDASTILSDRFGTIVTITDAVGEGFGKFFYLLVKFTDSNENTRYAAMRFENTGKLWEDEDTVVCELKVHDLSAVQPAAIPTGPIGNAANLLASTVVNALLGKKQRALEFMKFVPTPTIVSNAPPTGGGSLLQSPNILSPYVEETFCIKEEDLTGEKCNRFQLSLQNVSLTDGSKIISSDEWMTEGTYWTLEDGARKLTDEGVGVLQRSVRIEKYTAVNETDYEWQSVDLSTVFTTDDKDFVNTASAALWIPKAGLGVSPVEGEPNVRITYIRNYEEYKEGLDALISSELSCRFGVGGYKDRLFLANGNRIYYSGMDDPMYFGELCYIEPCTSDKKIVAMGGAGQVLYAVDSEGITHVIAGTTTEDDTSTFLLDAAFVIADRVQGEKPVGNLLKVFGGEFCYLSEEGVVAIRHDNFYDKRYAQNRSRMLGDSIKASGEKIVGGTVWGNFLVIATQKRLYLLDELQQARLDDYKYSGVQYEVFPFTFDMEALGAFEITMVWATSDGRLRFQMLRDGAYYSNCYDERNGVDQIGKTSGGEVGRADIIAEWVTPPLELEEVHRGKLIQELWLSVGKVSDAVTVEYRTDRGRDWRMLRKANGRFIPFDYSKIDYGAFSYCPQVPKLQLKVRGRPARPFYKIQFRFTSKGGYDLTLSSFGFYYKKEVI